MKAIQIEAFGKPVEVVKVVEIPDVGAPGAGEVVLALEASPIKELYDKMLELYPRSGQPGLALGIGPRRQRVGASHPVRCSQ
jgi:hypothetical protein